MGKHLLCVYALITFAVLTGTSESQEYGESIPLYYDARSGNLTFDATNVAGGRLEGYGIKLPFDGYWVPGTAERLYQSFRVEEFTPFMDTFFTAPRDKSIGEYKFGGIAPGVYSIGNVMPPNLSAEDIVKLLGPTPFPVHAYGAPETGLNHRMQPVFGASPFPAINDPSVGVPPETTWASAASLLYDPSTGGVSFDSSRDGGGTIFSYEIGFAENVFRPDSFTPVTDGYAVLLTQTGVTEVGVAGIPAGRYFLGEVLPPGLTSDGLSASITMASFVGQPGHGLDSLDIRANGVTMALAIVPEPSTFSIGIVFALGLLSVNRCPAFRSRKA